MSHRSFRYTVGLTSVAPFIKKEKLGVVVHAFSPRTWETEQRQVDLCRFKPKLVYTVNSRASRGDSVFS